MAIVLVALRVAVEKVDGSDKGKPWPGLPVEEEVGVRDEKPVLEDAVLLDGGAGVCVVL